MPSFLEVSALASRMGMRALCAIALMTLAGCTQTANRDTDQSAMSPGLANCLEAIAAKTGVCGVSADGVPEENASLIKVRVPDAAAPWNCIVDDQGNVQEIYYSAEG